MKKIIALALALTLTVCLAACGSAPAKKDVDLEVFWQDLAAEYDMPDMGQVSDDMLESYYPGLKDIKTVQRVVQVPVMSAVVSEYVFLRLESADDAAAAAEILQKRIDDQAAGGAWYPESVENWGKAQVVTNGEYVAMIAAGDNTQAIAESFNALFK